jgi:hypothetical protein
MREQVSQVDGKESFWHRLGYQLTRKHHISAGNFLNPSG